MEPTQNSPMRAGLVVLDEARVEIKRTRRINGMPGHREMAPFVSEYGRLDNNRLRQILSLSWAERIQRVAAPLLDQRSYALTRVRASNATRAGCVDGLDEAAADRLDEAWRAFHAEPARNRANGGKVIKLENS